MPTSTYVHIGAVASFLGAVRPESVLDVGLGNGKMGFIARDLLDVMLGQRHLKKDWKIKIDGVEIFPDYIQAHQKAIYDEIFIGDVSTVLDRLGKYDVIILGDVLEHLKKEDATELLHKCAEHCEKAIILNIPLGEKWTQGAEYGNEAERHLSFWTLDELTSFALAKAMFNFPGIGDYASLLLDKDLILQGAICR